jgi:hypothetical protein
MRLSYYGGGHYDSVVAPSHAAGCIRETPGVVEDLRIAEAVQRVSFAGSFEDTRAQSERAATEAEELSLALQVSRQQFDRQDNDLELIFLSQTTAALHEADAEATDRAMVMGAEERELEEALALSTAGAAGAEPSAAAAELEIALNASMGLDPELQHALEQSKAAFGSEFMFLLSRSYFLSLS